MQPCCDWESLAISGACKRNRTPQGNGGDMSSSSSGLLGGGGDSGGMDDEDLPEVSMPGFADMPTI